MGGTMTQGIDIDPTGTRNWVFNDDGLMRLRFASINDLPIKESDRDYHWPLGRRPDDHPGLSDFGF
jgi:nuclear transport factor 2 (NTF2) superfamily protein